MIKKLASAFVVLVFLVMAVPASAQGIGYIPTSPEGWWYKIQGNQVMMLQADNLGMVRDFQRQGYRSARDDMRWNGSAYGLSMANGGFYPMYDRNMRPMGSREATVTGAAIGAAVGYGVTGNTRGTAIGAAGGAIIGLITRGRNNNRRDNGIVTPPAGQDQQGVGRTADGLPIAIGTRPNRQGPVSNPPSMVGEWRVQNKTSKRAELWDGEQFIARIEPWQSVQADAPAHGYKAVLLIPNRSGGLSQEQAEIRASENFNGWDIIVPAVQ